MEAFLGSPEVLLYDDQCLPHLVLLLALHALQHGPRGVHEQDLLHPCPATAQPAEHYVVGAP